MLLFGEFGLFIVKLLSILLVPSKSLDSLLKTFTGSKSIIIIEEGESILLVRVTTLSQEEEEEEEEGGGGGGGGGGY